MEVLETALLLFVVKTRTITKGRALRCIAIVNAWRVSSSLGKVLAAAKARPVHPYVEYLGRVQGEHVVPQKELCPRVGDPMPRVDPLYHLVAH